MINKKTPKKIGIVFTILLFSLCIKNTNAQGPNAPEAASFEPVDATDMVNLVTGDLSYVLPLLNVPSPEGGYPIALSYHAGIAMDQEASWTGLGWNLNPGAINRSVNGYPDDYNNSLLSEYFYDEGDEKSFYSLSLGYTNGATSVGLGFSWGSNRSLGGYVSAGLGANIDGVGNLGISVKSGSNGSSIGIGLSTGKLTLGATVNTNGNISSSVGFDTNGIGFGVSTNGDYSFSFSRNKGRKSSSVDFTLSSSGIGLSVSHTNKNSNNIIGGAGVGLQLQFNNTVSMGDYTTKSSNWQIPLMVPTPIGVFSLTFGKQKYEYYMGKSKSNFVSGPIYFNSNKNIVRYVVFCFNICGSRIVTYNKQEALNYQNSCNCFYKEEIVEKVFMDTYMVTPSFSYSSTFSSEIALFPNYDKYNVQAQGLSGGMSSRLFENGNLFGLGTTDELGLELKYPIKGSNYQGHNKFSSMPYFYFDNEITTHLGITDVNEAIFNTSSTNNSILEYYDSNVVSNAKPRRKNGNYIEYFTTKEIVDNYNTVKSKGYLNPDSGFNVFNTTLPENGISAFKITAPDGKTYHYSLPVYNHEIITRTYGLIEDRLNERQSYQEKRQLEPYATHWLLTAVTGSDYLDLNNNGFTDKGDYGYWVKFEYGKWSDAFIWKNPYGEDYFEELPDNSKSIHKNPDQIIKTWIRGRKEVYYLDKIKTRTHSAIFVKSERDDSKSIAWNYYSVRHLDNIKQNGYDYQSRFNIPSQNSLRLDKIILVNEDDDTLDVNYGNSSSSFVDVTYIESNNQTKTSRAYYNTKENLVDIDDNWSQLIGKAIKVIDLSYDYSLAKNSPNTISNFRGRLTLNSVSFKGKKGKSLMPSYHFDYLNDQTFNIDNKDGFGYNRNDNSSWSLHKITTPIGGKIEIEYEPHKIETSIDHEFIFTNYSRGENTSTYPTYTSMTDVSNKKIEINSEANFDSFLEIGAKVGIEYRGIYPPLNGQGVLSSYYGTGTITNILGPRKYEVSFDNDISISYGGSAKNIPMIEAYFNSPTRNRWAERYYRSTKVSFKTNPRGVEIGGCKVSNIKITDDLSSYRKQYTYGNKNDGIGYISYLPYAPELQKEIPYSSELPAPKVMYEYVTMESFGTTNKSEGKTQYKFKVLKEKETYGVKFGDLYELKRTFHGGNYVFNTDANKLVYIRSFMIKDNLAALGQLLEMSSYNGKGHLLSKIENTYYAPGETPNLLGVTKESYQSYREIKRTNPNSIGQWFISNSSRLKYPSVLKSSKEYKNGFIFTSEFKEFDEIIGQATEVHSFSNKGLEIKSKSIPAYTISDYNPSLGYGMGSKVDDITNKNMLTQEAMTKTYIKVGTEWKETGVGITTWNNDWSYTNHAGTLTQETATDKKIWRKHKSFVWDGALNDDGTYNGFTGDDDGFKWGLGDAQTNTKWKNTSTTTQYNHYSKPLEVRDINGNYAATKMCDDNSKVLATSNAAYTEIYYSGAEHYADDNEDYFDGQVRASTQSNRYAHTGFYSIIIDHHLKGFEVNLPSNPERTGQKSKFKISVWVKKDKYTYARIHINGETKVFNGEKVFAGDWVQLIHYEELSTEAETVYVTSVSGKVRFDDFRLHPVTSMMTSYVYNQWDELWYIIGNNGLASKFEYDSAGRLKTTYTEVVDDTDVTGGFKKINETRYNYKD